MPKITSAELEINRVHPSLDPTDTQLIVTLDPAKPLPLGGYIFHLQVEDEAGIKSTPFEFRLQVVDTTAPNANIKGPPTVSFRNPFTLDGSGSFDPDNGKITKYFWRRVG